MPRGFSEAGKVLKLNKSLYGLRQSLRNFFLHLKEKLEQPHIGFHQSKSNPYLFISDKVLCLVHVNNTLFFSPQQRYIDEVVQKLCDSKMQLKAADDVAGFLGVHIDC